MILSFSFRPGGAAEALQKAKQQGKVRFVGFTGHTTGILAAASTVTPHLLNFPLSVRGLLGGTTPFDITQMNELRFFGRRVLHRPRPRVILQPLITGRVRLYSVMKVFMGLATLSLAPLALTELTL
jgi:hypothetical protein